MATATNHWVDIIEASYRIDQSETDWLHGVLTASQAKLDHGRGMYAISYDLNGANGVELRAATSLDFPEGTQSLVDVLGRCTHKTLDAPTTCGTASQLMGSAFEQLTAIDTFKHRGVGDTLGINVRDPTSFGCLLVGLLPKVDALPRAETNRWKKITAHIAAGYRLQRAFRTRASQRTAIVSTTGKIEHAEGDAASIEAREDLRAAVMSLEVSREKDVSEEEAVDLRKGLVSARWTLLEEFETSGRRYFVARENAAIQPAPTLTARERQVLGYAALGHSDKLIAYDLGIAWSTVRVLMARAGAKLGTKKRDETVRAFVAILRAHDPAAS